jgi:hypothetical protein
MVALVGGAGQNSARPTVRWVGDSLRETTAMWRVGLEELGRSRAHRRGCP